MKRIVLYVWLVLATPLGIVHATTASSGAFRIDKPQVIIQGGANSEGVINIGQRISPEAALDFENSGLLIQGIHSSALRANVSTQLIETDDDYDVVQPIKIHAQGKSTYEYIHVRRNTNLDRSITYALLQSLDTTGTNYFIDVALPKARVRNVFFGTLDVIVGSY